MGVVEMLMESKWWQASQGHDHVIVAHHPNAFRYCFQRWFLKLSLLLSQACLLILGFSNKTSLLCEYCS
jgi:hypothetical protein